MVKRLRVLQRRLLFADSPGGGKRLEVALDGKGEVKRKVEEEDLRTRRLCASQSVTLSPEAAVGLRWAIDPPAAF